VKGVLLTDFGNFPGVQEAPKRSLAINPDYVLLYLGFTGSHENLAALNTTCIPAATYI
jgi:hypothetical protein